MKRRYLALFLVMFWHCSLQAAEPASGETSISSRSSNTDGGYFELGLGMRILYLDRQHINLNTKPIVAFGYRYKRFFADASQGSADGLSVGFNLWQNRRWEVDALVSSANGRLTNANDSIDYSKLTDAEREEAVRDRETFFNGAGLRVTGYFGDAILQYRLVSDIHAGNGFKSSVRLGYNRQLKNWTFNTLVGAYYLSKETTNYWYGVSEQEASVRYPQYSLGSAVEFFGELGLSYPVTEHVVFRSSSRFTQFDKGRADSPLQLADFNIRTNMSISYVF